MKKRYVFHYFCSAKVSKLDLNFELSWTSSWEGLGGLLDRFWEPRGALGRKNADKVAHEFMEVADSKPSITLGPNSLLPAELIP